MGWFGDRTSLDSLGVEHSFRDWLQKGYDAEEYDNQILFYLNAIELKPDYPHTYFNLGNTYNNVTSLGYHKIYI